MLHNERSISLNLIRQSLQAVTFQINKALLERVRLGNLILQSASAAEVASSIIYVWSRRKKKRKKKRERRYTECFCVSKHFSRLSH